MYDASMMTITWQKKRKWMFINNCFGAIAYGLSLNAYLPTEYLYLKETVKVEKPELYFGLSHFMLYFSGAISGIIASIYADYTKNIREICLFENVLNIIGNLMYSLYYSPYLILFGQLLIGSTAARMTSVTGEISRVYEKNEITNKIAVLGAFSVIGCVLGPCLTFLFQYIDVAIGNWTWNIGNMIGIMMIGFYFFQFVMNYFTLFNVSKEFTLKKENLLNATLDLSDMEEENDNLLFKKEPENNVTSFTGKYIFTLKVLLRNKYILFWLFMCIVTVFARGLQKIVVPIKSEEYLNWKQKDIAKLWAICMVFGTFPTLIIISILSKYVNDFFLYLISPITLLISLTLMGLLPVLKQDNRVTEIMLYCTIIINFVSSAVFQILSRSMLAKFVPENVQAVTEGIRSAVFELTASLQGVSVMLPVTYLSQTMFAMAILISGILAYYIAEEGTFRNIRVIDIKVRKLSKM